MATLLLNSTFLKPHPTSKTNSTLSSPSHLRLGSQFSALSLSLTLPHPATPSSSPALRPIVARRVCPFTGKRTNRANNVTYSNHKTRKLQFVNLQYKRLWWEAGKRYVKLRLSTKALKTIEKHGLDAVAKKARIDLSKK